MNENERIIGCCPAPVGLLAIFSGVHNGEIVEEEEQVAALAQIEDRNLKPPAHFLVAMVIDGEEGVLKTVDHFDNFIRLEWKQQAVCQCSKD